MSTEKGDTTTDCILSKTLQYNKMVNKMLRDVQDVATWQRYERTFRKGEL